MTEQTYVTDVVNTQRRNTGLCERDVLYQCALRHIHENRNTDTHCKENLKLRGTPQPVDTDPCTLVTIRGTPQPVDTDTCSRVKIRCTPQPVGTDTCTRVTIRGTPQLVDTDTVSVSQFAVPHNL
jgi:hypothetical protein